jgi:hypothetical protein
MPDRLKKTSAAVGRLFLYALVTALLTLSLAFAFSNASNKQALQLLRDVRNASRATACVLALPVTENGRSPDDVAECFASNGIDPPQLGINDAVP